MLGKLLAARRRPRPDPHALDQPERVDVPFDFPPMRPLRPEPAANDDPLAGVCQVVEEALREAGHLP